MSKLSLPTHLLHKPICALPYREFDGKYAGNTDVEYISVGLAQWDQSEISIKVWRHTGDKWSRQSEELPLHRPIDMTLFLARALFGRSGNVINIKANTFQNQTEFLPITCSPLEEGVYRKIKDIDDFAKSNPDDIEIIKCRLRALADTLEELKVAGKI